LKIGVFSFPYLSSRYDSDEALMLAIDQLSTQFKDCSISDADDEEMPEGPEVDVEMPVSGLGESNWFGTFHPLHCSTPMSSASLQRSQPASSLRGCKRRSAFEKPAPPRANKVARRA
jgi:hypothetical protein